MVECARRCYKQYPTVVNALTESGISYDNTPEAYASMDNNMSKSRLGIGWSSNLAMLAISYYFTELNEEECNENLLRELEDVFIILAVIAQVIIDGCKREYEVNGMDEIKRIQALDCMHHTIGSIADGKFKERKYDFPLFMKYTRPVPYTKNGKELPYSDVSRSKKKITDRIDPSLICPMNWVEECLDKIQGIRNGSPTPTEMYFKKIDGKPWYNHMTRIAKIAKEYDNWIIDINNTPYYDDDDYVDAITNKAKYFTDEVLKIRTTNPVTINRMIEYCLGLNLSGTYKDSIYKSVRKYSLKILTLLYRSNRTKFLSNFVKNTRFCEKPL